MNDEVVFARSERIVAQAGCYPCCGADTFGDHRANVSDGLCSKERLLRALDAAADAMEEDGRFCAECGSDVIGNDPHAANCGASTP